MQINNYFLVRELIGILLILDLFSYLPFFHIFFGKDYNQDDLFNKKSTLCFIQFLWFITALFLILGIYPCISSFALLIIFRHFFINNRWKNLLRGGGAPGFISNYAVTFIFLFELSFLLDKTFVPHDVHISFSSLTDLLSFRLLNL